MDYKDVFSEKGYQLFRLEEDIEKAIVDAICDKNTRYILGIPIVINNSEVDFDILFKYTKDKKVKDDLNYILSITNKLISNTRNKKKISKIIKNKKIKKNSLPDLQEFRETYQKYISLKDSIGDFQKEERYYLSFLFSKKQIEILYKIKYRKKLTKTEKEYFSRIIKKKLRAIKESFNLADELLI